jgi:hypothetical protein
MAAKKKNSTPAVRYLRYELTNSGSAGTETSHFIDLARDLSRVNRRLYRQGRDYHVKRITIVSSNTPNGGNRVSFSTVPDSWVTQRAWQRGFKTWNMMNKKAMAAAGNDVSGKWSDFKVYLTDDMRTGTVLSPKDNGGFSPNAGDWEYSLLVSPDGTTGADEFYLHMLGDHNPAGGTPGSNVSVGLVKSYGDARATVDTDQPNVPGSLFDDPLANLFDDGTVTDEVLADLSEQNDNAPYGTNNYPGDDGNMPKPIVVQDTTIVDGRATVGGFTARCGLIEIEAKSGLPSDVFSVLVELAPGSYRGIGADVI